MMDFAIQAIGTIVLVSVFIWFALVIHWWGDRL